MSRISASALDRWQQTGHVGGNVPAAAGWAGTLAPWDVSTVFCCSYYAAVVVKAGAYAMEGSCNMGWLPLLQGYCTCSDGRA